MTNARKRLIAGVVLGGLAGGTTLGGILRAAGPGDPPVIILPSARAQMKSAVVPAQATAPVTPPVAAPKLEMLPPPTAQPPVAAPKFEMLPPPTAQPPVAAPKFELSTSSPPVAKMPIAPPPLVVAPSKPLQVAQPVPTLPAKEPAAKLVVKETAPAPRMETASAKPSTVLPPPAAGPVPSRLAPPGDSTMPIRSTAAAAALTALVATAPAAPQPPVIEKITDYAKAEDVKALKAEIEALKKEIAALTGKAGESARGADVKSLHDDLAALKKDIAALPKPTDNRSLKDDLELLKKDIAALPKPTDNKNIKDDLDLLKKDVAALGAYLRETLDGKVDAKGFTHEGLAKQLTKMNDRLTAMETKIGENRTAGSSPVTRGEEKLVTARGIVRLVNEYPVEIAIVVNGASHRLEPNARKDIPVAAGSFKYQLLANGGLETERSIKDNETVTLTIR